MLRESHSKPPSKYHEVGISSSSAYNFHALQSFLFCVVQKVSANMKQTLDQILSAAQSKGTSSSKINGFHQEKTGLKILVVGAGIGGLTAAIALRQQGHEVLVSALNLT
jgi:NADPH-dependent glutamate synthase beta subunit-like oxidoreductase